MNYLLASINRLAQSVRPCMAAFINGVNPNEFLESITKLRSRLIISIIISDCPRKRISIECKIYICGKSCSSYQPRQQNVTEYSHHCRAYWHRCLWSGVRNRELSFEMLCKCVIKRSGWNLTNFIRIFETRITKLCATLPFLSTKFKSLFDIPIFSMLISTCCSSSLSALEQARIRGVLNIFVSMLIVCVRNLITTS